MAKIEKVTFLTKGKDGKDRFSFFPDIKDKAHIWVIEFFDVDEWRFFCGFASRESAREHQRDYFVKADKTRIKKYVRVD